MVTVNLEEAQRNSNYDHLMMARGRAIQAYATLEMSLCSLFCFLLQTPQHLGSIVFFKINNARTRNTNIVDLMRKRDSNNLPFVKEMIKFIGPLDQKRNEIVHWHTVTNIGVDETGKQTNEAALTPPNFWAYSEEKLIDVSAMTEFGSKCDFIARSMNIFYLFISKAAPVEEPWLSIFREPIVYPPRSDHPLAQNSTEPLPLPATFQV